MFYTELYPGEREVSITLYKNYGCESERKESASMVRKAKEGFKYDTLLDVLNEYKSQVTDKYDRIEIRFKAAKIRKDGLFYGESRMACVIYTIHDMDGIQTKEDLKKLIKHLDARAQ